VRISPTHNISNWWLFRLEGYFHKILGEKSFFLKAKSVSQILKSMDTGNPWVFTAKESLGPFLQMFPSTSGSKKCPFYSIRLDG